MTKPLPRVTEQSLVIPTLRLLADQPNGFMATSDLIAELEEQFHPRGLDKRILDQRNDTRFSQKVRNMISHRTSKSSFIFQGFANYDEKRAGLRITAKGRKFLTAQNAEAIEAAAA